MRSLVKAIQQETDLNETAKNEKVKKRKPPAREFGAAAFRLILIDAAR
jgi:hypothetical protein